MKFLSLMTAASVAETESKDKMKGKIPKYPATAEPLDEGNSTVWMKWEPDFKTYANINNLAPLLTPPHYGKVQIPAEIENGPAEPTPPAEGIPVEPEKPDAEADVDVQEAYIRDRAEYGRLFVHHKQISHLPGTILQQRRWQSEDQECADETRDGAIEGRLPDDASRDRGDGGVSLRGAVRVPPIPSEWYKDGHSSCDE